MYGNFSGEEDQCLVKTRQIQKYFKYCFKSGLIRCQGLSINHGLIKNFLFNFLLFGLDLVKNNKINRNVD